MKVDSNCGTIHTYTEFVLMACWEGMDQQLKEQGSLKSVMQHHMGDTMVYFVVKTKSGRADSFGQPCMKIPKISFEDARDANCMEESPHEMQCPYRTTSR